MKKKLLSSALAIATAASMLQTAFAANLSSPFIYKNGKGGYVSVVKNADDNLNSFIGSYDNDGRLKSLAVGKNLGAENGVSYYEAKLSSDGVIKSFLMDSNAIPKATESVFTAEQTYDCDFEITDDFESASVGAGIVPSPYGYYRWSKSDAHSKSNAGVIEVDGNKCLYIMNKESGYGGFTYVGRDIPMGRYSYTISCDVKFDGAATDQLRGLLQFYKNGAFVKQYNVDATGYDSSKSGWQRVSFTFMGDNEYFKNYKPDRIDFGFGTYNVGENSDTDTSRIYFDNLKFSVDEEAASDFVFCDDFEDANNDKPLAGWGYGRWSVPGIDSGYTGDASKAGFVTEPDGNKCLYIMNNSLGYGGFSITPEGLPLDADSYEISYDVKYDSDANDTLNGMLMLWKKIEGSGNVFRTQIKKNSTAYDKNVGGWQRVSYTINKSELENYDYNWIYPVFGTNDAAGSDNPDSDTSKIYFDNFKIIAKYNSTIEGGLAKIRAYNADGTENKYSWYNTGDTVVYRFEDQVLLKYDKIKAVVYDIDNTEVLNKEMLSYAVLDSGFDIPNLQKGYYEVEFYGIDQSGTQTRLRDGYVYNKGYATERASFAVVDGTKAMSDRNETLMSSNSCTSDADVDLLDIVGFSGVRIHTVQWGKTASEYSKGFQIQYTGTPSDDFDWTRADEQMNRASRFKNVIPNVCFTPSFATENYIEGAVTTNWSVVGAYYANLYMPDSTKFPQMTKYAMKNFTERYKDRENLYGIEFWNEPYYGEARTAFWYDSGENYLTMTNEAWEGVREADPYKKIKFITAGHLGGTSGARFMYDMLQNETYKKNTEMISFHGSYGTGEQFESVANSIYGKGNIDLMNSEGYYYSYKPSGAYVRDYMENNLAMLATYMRETKAGYKFKGYFNILDDTLYGQDEVALDEQTSKASWGLFREIPAIQPHSGAVVLHEFFELMGKNFTYDNEYDVDGIKAVSFNNDGSKMVVVWNPKGASFTLPNNLKSLIGSSSSFVDYEGKAVSSSQTLNGKKMYYIVNADSTALASLTATPNTALNASFKAPYYTCEGAPAETEKSKDTITVSGRYTWSDAFDHTWVSNPLGEEPNSEGEHRVKVKVKRTYKLFSGYQYYLDIQVESRDDEPAMGAKNGEDLINYDSLVVSFNATGEEGQEDTFYVGLINPNNEYGTDRVPAGTPVVYKAKAYNGAGAYSGSAAGTTLSDAPTISFKTWNHYHTGRNNELENWFRYRFKIPFTEIAGLSKSSTEVKMSIADIKVGYNPEKEKVYTKYGAWTFGDGLYPFESASDKYNVSDYRLYGTLKLSSIN